MAKSLVVPFPKMALLQRSERSGKVSLWRYLCSDAAYLYVMRVKEGKATKNSRAAVRWDLRQVAGLFGTTIVHIEECICPPWMLNAALSDKEKSRTVAKQNMLLWMLEEGADELVTKSKRLNELLKEAAKLHNVEVPYIRALLTRHFYYGGHENALMSLHRGKGGRGVSRLGSTTKKMGRPNDNVVLDANTALCGRNMSRKLLARWKDVLWEDYVQKNVTMAESYERLLRQLGGYNRDANNKVQFFPIDPRKLPERALFFHYATKLIAEFDMKKAKVGAVHWHQKFAARTGTSDDLCQDAIDIYDMDGMEFNIELIDEKGKKRGNVGKPLVVLAVARGSTAVVGWFISLGRENNMAYRYCLFNAFTPKAARLDKYNLSHLRGFVHGGVEQIFVDRGPALARISVKAVTEVMKVDMLIAKPGQGESKAIVENVNGRFQHALSDLPGAFKRTNFLRDKAQHAAAEATAAITYSQFVVLLLNAISDHNLFTPVSAKLTKEMRAAGVKPNPKSVFLWHRSLKRGDAASEWPESLVYKKLLRGRECLAPRGVVTWSRNEYSSSDLAQHFDTWISKPHGKDVSPQVMVYRLEEDETILLWEKPDGSLAKLQKRRVDTNPGDASEWWERDHYNRLDNADERKQRAQRVKDGTLSDAKEGVMASADGLPKKKGRLKPGEKTKNRQDANERLYADTALEALKNLGIVDAPYAQHVGNRGSSAGYARAVDADDDLAVNW